MKTDKIKIYTLEILLVLVVAFLALFESNIVSKFSLAVILLIFALIISKVIKKRNIISTSSRQVLLLMLGFAVIYLALFYIAGMYFGFYKSSVKFGIWGITTYIIPLTVIIIASEKIRQVLLTQKGKKNSILVFVAMVLIDIIVYAQVYDASQYNDFLAIVGFVTFASISCNLLYNYLSTRYGAKPIIVYRLITVLYIYIIPICPDVYIFIRSIVRMIIPYFIYLIVDKTYSTNTVSASSADKKKKIVGNSILITVAFVVAYLVSCQFTYGMLVVGSGSMTGTINKGDAVIYKQLKKDKVKEGDVIIFQSGDLRVVHRVIDIRIVNGQYRYYTKGDANQVEDDKFVTDDRIIGKTKLRIRYIGYPTLWIRDLFR